MLAVVVAAAVAVAVINPFSSPGPSRGRPAPPVAASPGNPARAPAAPPRQPWGLVRCGGRPRPITPRLNEINAVNALQQQLGRRLSIVHTYVKWQAQFPTTSALTFLAQGSMLLISWAGTDTRQIASGADDAWIRTRAAQVKALGKPVFLEWRWEMDRPNLRAQVHSGADYVRAWDRIRSDLRRRRGPQRRLGLVPDRGGVRRRPGRRLLPGRRRGGLGLRGRLPGLRQRGVASPPPSARSWPGPPATTSR